MPAKTKARNATDKNVGTTAAGVPTVNGDTSVATSIDPKKDGAGKSTTEQTNFDVEAFLREYYGIIEGQSAPKPQKRWYGVNVRQYYQRKRSVSGVNRWRNSNRRRYRG